MQVQTELVNESEMQSGLFKSVQSIIADTLQIMPDRITPNARFREDLGADSLDLVELTQSIAREFELDRFDINLCRTQAVEFHINRIVTVGQAVEYLGTLLQARTEE